MPKVEYKMYPIPALEEGKTYTLDEVRNLMSKSGFTDEVIEAAIMEVESDGWYLPQDCIETILTADEVDDLYSEADDIADHHVFLIGDVIETQAGPVEKLSNHLWGLSLDVNAPDEHVASFYHEPQDEPHWIWGGNYG